VCVYARWEAWAGRYIRVAKRVEGKMGLWVVVGTGTPSGMVLWRDCALVEGGGTMVYTPIYDLLDLRRKFGAVRRGGTSC
jgi:hypothetical protein